MVADFLPLSVTNIQDLEAVALFKQLQRRVIQVRFNQATVLVSTAYIHQPDSSIQFPQTPILLLHGFDSSVLEFRRLLPLLAIKREAWALDLFGFGFTEHSSQVAVNPQTIRQHLYSFLSTCICQSVILVGASLGGAVAIDFALHHPDSVKALVLIDSVGFSGSFPLGQFLPSPVIEWGADWLHLRKLAALTAALFLPINQPTLIDAVRCSLLHHEMPGWKAAIASFTESGGYSNPKLVVRI